MESKIGSYPLLISTYLSHLSINYVMTTYFFCKQSIMLHFEMIQTQIGIADACRFAGCVIGLIILFFVPHLKRIASWYYAVNVILFAVSLLLIPLLVYFNQKQDFWLYMIGFTAGIFKSSFWTLLLMIVYSQKQSFSKSQQKQQQIHQIDREQQVDQIIQAEQKQQDYQKVVLVLWTSSFDVGSILGFLGSNFMVYSLNYNWQQCLQFGVAMVVITIIPVVYFTKTNQNSTQNHQKFQIQNEKNLKQKKNQQFSISQLLYVFISQPKNILFIVVFFLFHQIIFERNMIYPDYLFKVGYKGFEGYLPSLCNVFSALGNFSFAGFQYFIFFIKPKICKKQKNQIQLQQLQNNSKQEKKQQFAFSTTIFLFIVCIINGLLVLYEIKMQQQKNIFVMTALLCAFAFFFGGPDDYYTSYELVSVINTIKDHQLNQIPKQNEDNIQIDKNIKNETMQQNEGKQISKQGLILNGIQIISFLLCICGIIAASSFVQHCTKIINLDYKYYFFWSFCIVLILLVCDIFRNVIKLKQKKLKYQKYYEKQTHNKQKQIS